MMLSIQSGRRDSTVPSPCVALSEGRTAQNAPWMSGAGALVYITCPRPALYRCDCEARTIGCAAISNSALIARGMRLWYHLSERGARARGPRGVGRPKRDLSAQKCGFEQIEVDAQGVCAYNIVIEHVI